MEKQIIGLMNSYTDGLSGGDLHLLKVFKYLTTNFGWKATIITSWLGAKLVKEEGVRCNLFLTTQEKEWKKGGIFLFHRYLLRTIFGIREILQVQRAPITYISSDFFPDVLPALFYKLRYPKTKLVFSFHLVVDSPWRPYYWRFLPSALKKPFCFDPKTFIYFLNQFATRFAARFFGAKIFVMNERDKKWLIKKKISQEKIYIIGNGIDLKGSKETASKKKKEYEGVFVGRLVAQKGISDLIEIWQLVCQKEPKARLLIIGDGPLRSILEKEIHKRGLDSNIILLGKKMGKEKDKFIQSARVFVYPSLYESFGIVILEALASGLPVVTYDLPIYKEIYQNILFTVPICNYRRFAKTILKVLKSKPKGEIERRALLINQFAWENIALKEALIFDKLVST